MKFASVLVGLFVSANGFATTTNDCFNEEGATLGSSCTSLWYSSCRHLTVHKDDTCNVETHGDASMNWYSSDIQVSYWTLTWQDAPENLSQDGSVPENQWSLMESNQACLPESISSEEFVSGTKLLARGASCGFKFQIINLSSTGDFDLTVLTSGSQALFASLTLAATAFALF